MGSGGALSSSFGCECWFAGECAAMTETPESQQAEVPFCVAVAEDEAELREYYQKVLPHLGYQIVGIFENGEELVQHCFQSMPHVIVCDVDLQRLSGPESVKLIRSRHPVAAVYVTENRFEDVTAEKVNRAVVLKKPFSMSDLEQAIAQAIATNSNSSNFNEMI